MNEATYRHLWDGMNESLDDKWSNMMSATVNNAGIPSRLEDQGDATVYDKMMDDLAANADDWTLRSILADWATDNYRPQLAECLRWMGQHKKRPYHGSSQNAVVDSNMGRGTWFNAGTISEGLGDPESDIPAAVFTHLDGGNEVANHKSFPDLRAAEEAFQAAWVKAREGGWVPE